MKKFKLENNVKITTGFQTPEGYFDDFSARVIQQLPEKEPKVISIFQRKKIWIYAAAAVLIASMSVLPVYTNFKNQYSDIDETTLENYITYQSNISTADMASLLDDDDIQNITIDLDIEESSLENELISNKNLEEYIIN